MNYSETVDYLFHSLPVFHHSGGTAYKPGLQTIRELSAFYGHPHTQYPSIHIAGTNGKGSVAHMLAAVLQGCGYTTGLFTSPHLIDFRERIKVNGEWISEQEVTEFVEKSIDVLKQTEASFFEVTTAMAFDHFARRKVDVAVIEAGMGGRLDATNIITPVLSVITNISTDHVQFLGNTPAAIASEKAGIIKPGIPVVIGETQAETAPVFETKAGEMQTFVLFADQYADVGRSMTTTEGQTFHILQHGKAHPIPVKIDLSGEYQRKNIITVLMTVQALRVHTNIRLKAEHIVPALEHAAQTTGLHGRWETLQQHPRVICDSAHNTAGIAWVTGQLKNCTFRTLRMIIGFVSDKDITGMLKLLPADAVYYFTNADIPRALNAKTLKRKAQPHGLAGKSYPSVPDALKAALADAASDDLIFVGGSIFVVSEILKLFTDVHRAAK
ncbi:MAG: bifunctional folylpolyglutamate synthase/dihydrofolate synthase [Bacteroidales bacterium]|jgi:dihydrofolate synthase/folylpolyglutamate synthase|nr:bifunctional folylpolyglutamate synthase/dihydrofolate synthase [Bacteroidales bacterium]